MTQSEKVLDKLAKMKRQMEGERAIGNVEAAETFAAAINQMLIRHELEMVDVDRAANGSDEVVTVVFYPETHGTAEKACRVAWQEALAAMVARAHMCVVVVCRGSNSVSFVGVKSHATVAEYCHGTLVAAADRMAEKEYLKFFYESQRAGNVRAARGFKAAWLTAFVERIGQRLRESVQQSINAAAGEGTIDRGSALVRINSALTRAQAHVANNMRTRSTAAARGRMDRRHGEGERRGRAAADAMPIDRRGIRSGSIRGALGE